MSNNYYKEVLANYSFILKVKNIKEDLSSKLNSNTVNDIIAHFLDRYVVIYTQFTNVKVYPSRIYSMYDDKPSGQYYFRVYIKWDVDINCPTKDQRLETINNMRNNTDYAYEIPNMFKNKVIRKNFFKEVNEYLQRIQIDPITDFYLDPMEANIAIESRWD